MQGGLFLLKQIWLTWSRSISRRSGENCRRAPRHWLNTSSNLHKNKEIKQYLPIIQKCQHFHDYNWGTWSIHSELYENGWFCTISTFSADFYLFFLHLNSKFCVLYCSYVHTFFWKTTRKSVCFVQFLFRLIFSIHLLLCMLCTNYRSSLIIMTKVYCK